MEKKKNPKANLEKSKSMFLFIGMIVAISSLIFAFSWNSVKEYAEKPKDDDFLEERHIVNTEQNEEKKPEKIDKPAPKLVVAEIIKISTDPNLVDTAEFWIEGVTDFEYEPELEPEPEYIIYDYSGTPPKFPGGTRALQVWVANHIVYPPRAKENGIEGTVYLRFEVTKTGKIGKVELQKSADPLLDEEAIRVIKLLPKFKPGFHNGQYVNVWYSIPISFKLN
jgi:protein TonB